MPLFCCWRMRSRALSGRVSCRVREICDARELMDAQSIRPLLAMRAALEITAKEPSLARTGSGTVIPTVSATSPVAAILRFDCIATWSVSHAALKGLVVA